MIEYIPAKTLISGYSPGSKWFGCNYNMNIYRGCCHGCIYCDSRSECYGDNNFDTVKVKEDALIKIRDGLRSKIKKGVVGSGAMSDPYNPLEKKLQLTRHSLELISAFDFGASIATKSTLITRDIDVLQEIKAHSPLLCKITITASEDNLSQIIEPKAPLSSARFDTVRALSDAGIFSGILLMPVLPYICDNPENIEILVDNAADSGARFIYPAFGMTLRDRQREYYYSKLDESFPGLSEKYRKKYGLRYSCTSPNAKRLWELFSEKCKEKGILYKMPQIIAAYKRGYGDGQLSLF